MRLFIAATCIQALLLVGAKGCGETTGANPTDDGAIAQSDTASGTSSSASSTASQPALAGPSGSAAAATPPGFVDPQGPGALSTPPASPPPPASPDTSGTDEYAENDPQALTDFRPALDQYGTWTDDPSYGTVWTPAPTAVGADFAPYVGDGHWVYENGDYAWVSTFDWGWAPFHYGRWVFIAARGWSWIPGHTYAGAWVTWRVGAAGFGFVGWAPTPPLWGWRGGVALRFANPIPAPYVFCRSGDVFAGSLRGRTLDREHSFEIARQTHVFAPRAAGRGVLIRGPGPEEIGIPRERIVHATGHEPGLAMAHQWQHPSGVAAARAGQAPHPLAVEPGGRRPEEPEKRPEPHNEPQKPAEAPHAAPHAQPAPHAPAAPHGRKH